jgi:curli biogenesis system outer membrane secretion channel CsgG
MSATTAACRGLGLSLAVLWLAGCASPQDKYFLETETSSNVFVSDADAKIDKVAILPFKAPTELIGASVSDLFVTEMLKAGRYELVERGQMAKVLSESELALAGLSASKAVEIGAMMGADGVIIGTVDEYSTVAHRGRTYPVVGFSVRLIDCASGKVLWSVDHADKAKDKNITLPQHARKVVHEMMAALYKEWRVTQKSRAKS